MKIRKAVGLVLTLVILMLSVCGCTQQQVQLPSETLDNPFTAPEQTEPVLSTQTQSPQPTEDTHPQATEPNYDFPQLETPQGVSIGLGGEKLIDDVGAYRVYSGGEMALTYSITASGFTTTGIGVLLFVDGQPQPYKTADDDTYRYLHVFYPPNEMQQKYDVTFVPVTGEAGDMLELSIININFPSYTALYGNYGFAYTDGAVEVSTRLYYESTPDRLELPRGEDRVLSVNVSHVDLTAAEIQGWSGDDLLKRIEANIYINGETEHKTIKYYGVDPDEPLKILVEMLGCHYAEYSLVLFVDNEPVYLDNGEILNISTNSGQKVVVEVELDISDSDGEVVVYGLLVPRNYFSIGFTNYCSLQSLGTSYIYSAETFAEFYLENYKGGE